MLAVSEEERARELSRLDSFLTDDPEVVIADGR
jgi:hypothetical protein